MFRLNIYKQPTLMGLNYLSVTTISNNNTVPGRTDTSKTSSKESQKSSQSTPTYNETEKLRKINKKRRNNNINRTRFRGTEEKIKGNVYQVYGEIGKLPN